MITGKCEKRRRPKMNHCRTPRCRLARLESSQETLQICLVSDKKNLKQFVTSELVLYLASFS